MASKTSLAWSIVLAGVATACSAPADGADAPGADESMVKERSSSALRVVELGPIQVGVPVTFEVPRNALGFTVIVESASPTDIVGVQALTGPRGEQAVHDYAVAGAPGPSVYALAGVVAAPVPRSDDPASTPSPGTWTLVASAERPEGGVGSALRASVRIQTTTDGRFHGGKLDLHVYVPDGLVVQDPTPAHPITAKAAAKDECVTARIDGFFASLSSLVGIDRGDVTFHPVAASYRSIKSQSALDDLFRESRVVADGQALHFMLANEIEPSPGVPSWGVSAAIGGAMTRTGTAASGVALAISPGFPAYGDALTMLHEAGHFFGLNHTSELASGWFDPVRDTPRCETISSTEFMQCEDRTNLMFPVYFAATNGGKNVKLSPTQVRVIQGSPLYRAYAR